MTREESLRISQIWDEIERSGNLQGDPWTKISGVAPRVVAEIGPHVTFRDIADVAGSRADNLNVVLDRMELLTEAEN